MTKKLPSKELESFTSQLIQLYRHVGLIEREQICCGTITVPQCIALQALLDAPVDNGTLANVLGTSVSATTRMIDGLEKRGWIERTRSPEDRRRVLIALNEEGRKTAGNLQQLTHESLLDVLALIPEKKHTQLMESLSLLCGALDRTKDNFPCCSEN